MADSSALDDETVVVVPTARRDAGITLTELLASFYLWLLLWLVVWAAVPALVLGYQPVLLTSGSMGPTISPGDLILLGDPPDDELLSQGAVITFPDPAVPGGLITHRIDGVREDGRYRTRGDANGAPDSTPVEPSEVVGVGRLLVPLIGLPLLWLRSDVLSFALFVGGTGAAAFVAGAANRAGVRRREAVAAREAAERDVPTAGDDA